MKNMLRVRYLLLTSFFGLFAVLQAHGQMKIGNHPTSIQPASILELESKNQALRLTQGDTGAVNTIIATEATQNGKTPYQLAEGMIMYQNTDSAFYMRMHGWWHKIMSADAVNNEYFKLGGNTITATSAFLGLKDAADSLRIGTDSLAASIIVMPDGIVKILDSLHAVQARVDSLYSGIAGIDTLAVKDSLTVAGGKFTVNSDTSKALNVFVMQDSVIMNQLIDAYGADTALLSIGPDGTVHKMSIDSLLSSDKPTINGINSNIFHLKFGEDAGTVHGPWIDSISARADSVLIFNIPSASGADNAEIRGLVDTTTQSFAGLKSFRDSVAVGVNTTPHAALDVHGNVNMSVNKVTADFDMTTAANAVYRTIICDVSGQPDASAPAITVTLPDPASINGRIYTIKKIGKNTSNQIGAFVTISGAFADGGSSMNVYNNWSSVTVQAQDGKWNIVGH